MKLFRSGTPRPSTAGGRPQAHPTGRRRPGRANYASPCHLNVSGLPWRLQIGTPATDRNLMRYLIVTEEPNPGGIQNAIRIVTVFEAHVGTIHPALDCHSGGDSLRSSDGEFQ